MAGKEMWGDLMEEGVENMDIDNLADKKGAVTVEDLRDLMDKRGVDLGEMTDEQLMAEYGSRRRGGRDATTGWPAVGGHTGRE